MEWEGGEEVEGRKTSARRARVKWTMGGVPSGSTKALVSKPAEVYIPRLGNRASEGFRSNKTPGCIEGTEISSNEGCKLKINSNLNNWNDLRPLRGGE